MAYIVESVKVTRRGAILVTVSSRVGVNVPPVIGEEVELAAAGFDEPEAMQSEIEMPGHFGAGSDVSLDDEPGYPSVSAMFQRNREERERLAAQVFPDAELQRAHLAARVVRDDFRACTYGGQEALSRATRLRDQFPRIFVEEILLPLVRMRRACTACGEAITKRGPVLVRALEVAAASRGDIKVRAEGCNVDVERKGSIITAACQACSALVFTFDLDAEPVRPPPPPEAPAAH